MIGISSLWPFRRRASGPSTPNPTSEPVAVSSPVPGVRSIIAASWQRCDAAGIDPARPTSTLARVPPVSLLERQVANAELLGVARSHADWVSATCASVPHVASLVDRDGVVLYTTGTNHEAVRTLARPGTDWSEASVGTNGAGTALTAGEPVTVEGSEHYLGALHGFTCTGAPVRGPAGEIIGAVNFTTAADVSLGAAERLRMVAHVAYAIEQELCYRDSLRSTSGLLTAERRLGEEARGRIEALEALRESEERFRGAFDRAAIGMAIVHPDGRWLRVNAALARLLGYSEAELAGATFESLTHSEDIEAGRVLFQRVLAGEIDQIQLEKRFLHRQGHIVWVALGFVVVRDEAGEPLYGISQMQDITERKRAEEALRAMQARFERHVANAPGVVYQYVYRPDGHEEFVYVSEGAQRLFGIDPAAARRDAAAMFALIHPEDRATFEASRRDAAARLAAWRWTGRLVLPTGDVRWVQVTSEAGQDPDGTIVTDGIIMDVTEQRRAAAHLAESEQRYRSLFNDHPDAVVSVDPSGRFQSANPACEVVSGYAHGELLGQPFATIVWPEQLPAVRGRFEAALAGEAQSFESAIRHKSGRQVEIAVTSVPIRVDGTVVGIYGIIKDLTARLSLEAQLRQAQKMEAVGRLAGGVAHDFNNLLTAILTNAELSLAALAHGPVREDVETIRQTAERAAALTRQLLAFSRQQVVQPRLVDLNALVANAERLLQRTLSAEIELALELAPTPVTVRVDPGQIEQVVLNLAVNAGDAMPMGGRLTLRTQVLVVDEAVAAKHRGLRPGDYVILEVEDAGTGIPPELLPHIFEPFFTTKEPGKGTGLGLATVYGIVKQFGGYTAVESTPGAGTTFTVFLPHLADVPAAEERLAPRALPTGTETVLVVEDEVAVRSTMRRILTRHGYTVLEARNGVEALRVFEEAAGRLDLLVTDLVMPELSGRELVAELRRRRACARAGAGAAPRILVMSGYDEQVVLKGEALPDGASFLEKPFTVEGLLRAVRGVLDAT